MPGSLDEQIVQQKTVSDVTLDNEYVINKIVDHGYTEDDEILFQVNYYGYGLQDNRV